MRKILILAPLVVCLNACVTAKDRFELTDLNPVQKREYAKANVILIGEQHDNPHHHKIQNDLLEKLGEEGRLKAVVFEQVDWTKQGLLTQLNRDNLGKLPARLEWDKSGWPPYELYEPLFATAVKYRAKVIAGGLPMDRIQILYKQGYEGAFSASEIERLRLRDKLPADALSQLETEIYEDHCKMVPEDHVIKMIPIQRARDAALLRGWQNEAPGNGVTVFILGSGHARKDYGIPTLIKASSPQTHVFSIALQETGAPATPEGAFDKIIATEKFDRPDSCAVMKAQLDKKNLETGKEKDQEVEKAEQEGHKEKTSAPQTQPVPVEAPTPPPPPAADDEDDAKPSDQAGE